MSGSNELTVVLLLWLRHVVTVLGKPSGSILSLTIPRYMEGSFCVSGTERLSRVISKDIIEVCYASISPWLGKCDLELCGGGLYK